MTEIVRIDSLHKTYRGGWFKSAVAAVRGVSLSIARGEAFGFIGPNGAGKSTTIKILIGALSGTSGTVTINGIDAADPRARLGMGYVPENPYLSDYLTPLEILTMGVRMHRLKLADERAHCMQWLDKFGLAAVANRRIRTFSKGMTQRTALAHALVIQPSLLILDEPLSGLDPVGRKEVVDILAEYRRQGGTLFFSSHVLHDVESIADRFGLIHKGELLTIRSPQELVEEQADLFVLRYQSDEPLRDSTLLRPGQYTLDVKQSDMPEVLTALNGRGGKIQEIRHKVSLETVFHQIVTAGS